MTSRHCSEVPTGNGLGFTLVEMLVVLTGASVLGGTLISLLVNQNRFHARNDDAMLAEQTARALVDGMSELRTAAAEDLLKATPDSVSVRFDLLRAIVCDTVAGGGVDLFVYDSVAAPNLPASFRGVAVSGPYLTGFVYSDGFVPGGGVSGAAAASCRANGADPRGTAPRAAFRRTNGWSGAFGQSPQRGAIVRTYGTLTYSVAGSGRGNGTLAMRRNGQEYATPLAAGARFEYGMKDGTTQTRVNAGNLKAIREVRLVTTTVGHTGLAAGRQLQFEARFRN